MPRTTCRETPLPETTKTRAEKHVRAVTEMDHAIVLERIAAKTAMDTELQHLKEAIHTEIWDKKYPVLKP